MTRAEKIKVFFKNNSKDTYFEFDEFGHEIYADWNDGDYIESEYLEGNIIFEYGHWILGNDLKFMNIIIK